MIQGTMPYGIMSCLGNGMHSLGAFLVLLLLVSRFGFDITIICNIVKLFRFVINKLYIQFPEGAKMHIFKSKIRKKLSGEPRAPPQNPPQLGRETPSHVCPPKILAAFQTCNPSYVPDSEWVMPRERH